MISVDVKCVYEPKTWQTEGSCPNCGHRKPMTVCVERGLRWSVKCNTCAYSFQDSRPREMRFVYGLVDPRTDKVMYVGCSTNPLERYRQHLVDKLHPGKLAWINELLEEGMHPSLTVFDVASGKDANALERALIDRLGAEGHGLLNILRQPSVAFHVVHEGEQELVEVLL